MGRNTFGSIFCITTWGESHGPAVGVVIDGCPSELPLTIEDLVPDLRRRAPGHHPLTSPRREEDLPEILSGVYEGKTTGSPIAIIIKNQGHNTAPYHALRGIVRPGHATWTYHQKYGWFDDRGGGRASGRETACRVAAGAVAKKLLRTWGITCEAHLSQIGDVEEALAAGDSVGGVVSFCARGVPAGLGDPIYAKLEARLADAMLSIPATKGFEMGEGFAAAQMRGSEHNDGCTGVGKFSSNHAGGITAGITTGQEIVGRVAFKPTSSIGLSQETVTLQGECVTLQLPEGSQHDPCVAIRAVPVVEAMLALVLVDAYLMHRTVRL